MNIQDLFRNLKVEFLESGHHHCRPGWIQLRHCPFCRSDNFHLGFNLVASRFSCWRCGSHHPVEVLMRLGLPREEARNYLRDKIPASAATQKKREGLKEPKTKGPMLEAHKRYLRGRGFDPEELARIWGLQGIAIDAWLSWRIYIPIHFQEEIVSWTTRAIGAEVVKRYVSASAAEESINHKHLIYGHDFCLHSIIVVEGPADAWAIGPGAGALFGTAFSTAQIRKISAIPNRFVCFDNSTAAQAAARKLCAQLAPFPGTTVNVCLDAKDPGCASQKELALLRKAAKV